MCLMLDALPGSRFNDIELKAAKHTLSISGHKYEVNVWRNPIYLQTTGWLFPYSFCYFNEHSRKTA